MNVQYAKLQTRLLVAVASLLVYHVAVKHVGLAGGAGLHHQIGAVQKAIRELEEYVDG